MSVALAASLCPVLALADSLVGGSTAGAISFPTVANTLTTQSSKKTVYVLAEVRYANDHAYSHRNYDENGAYAGDLYEAKERSRTVYSYNKNLPLIKVFMIHVCKAGWKIALLSLVFDYSHYNYTIAVLWLLRKKRYFLKNIISESFIFPVATNNSLIFRILLI